MTTKHKHNDAEHDHDKGDYPHIHDGVADRQYQERLKAKLAKAEAEK